MTTLHTISGSTVIVDSDIAKKYSDLKLYLIKGYVSYYKNGRTCKLHRLIIGAKDGQEVDHINRNLLDNRRQNLRICTRSENLSNRAGYGSSKFKGVSWNKDKNKFRAYTPAKRGEQIHIGYFPTEIEAAQAVERTLTI